MKRQLIEFYLIWCNSYINPETMANDYCITTEQCKQLIDIGRSLHEKDCFEQHERLKQ